MANTRKYLLSDLLYNASLPEVSINALSLDSRQVEKGALFFAYPGETQDGRDHIEQAIANGAAAIIYESSDGFFTEPSADVVLIPLTNVQSQIGPIASRFYHNSSHSLNMIGITGTNGKTSVAHFIAQALQQLGKNCAVLGTLGNGVLPDLVKSTHTTLDPIQLQQTLAQFRADNLNQVVMEVSSHALAQSRVAGVQFDTAVFTQLSRDHLDYHGDMPAYAAAKELLFQQAGLKNAVINVDDPFGRELVKKYQDKLNLVTYSLQGDHRHQQRYVAVSEVKFGAKGYLVKVESSWGRGEFSCAMLGTFNISNVLSVLAVLLLNNVAFDQALHCCSALVPVKGRMQMFGDEHQPKVVVDYAHTPDALEKTLAALRSHCEGELWCVFGCGGDRDPGKRPQMAAVAEKLSDHIIVTDDNPRHELPLKIAEDIVTGLSQLSNVNVILNRAEAIQTVVQSAKINDIVLIAGKGHEQIQIIGDQILPFDDAEQVTIALAKTKQID